MKTRLFAIALFGLFGKALFAQVAINTAGKPAHSSAMLDVQSTEKGMLVPRMKATDRIAIASPADGLLVYDVTSKSFWFYKSGAGWQEISNSASSDTLKLPYISSGNTFNDLFSISNNGSGASLEGINYSTSSVAVGVKGLINSTSAGTNSAGVRGTNRSTTDLGYGVYGLHEGNGAAVFGSSVGGYGIYGKTGTGSAGYFTTTSATNTNPVLSINNIGIGAGIDMVITNPNNGSRGISIDHQGVGPGILVTAKGGTALWGITSDADRAGVIGDNNFGQGILGRNFSGAGIGAVEGRNNDAGYGIYGYCTKTGIGVMGRAGVSNSTSVAGRFENINASNTKPALEAETNSTGWAADFSNTNSSSSGKGLRVSTAANEGGNAFRISNGVMVASYQDPYTSNAVIDDSYLIVRNSGNITLRTTGVVLGTVVWLVNFSGGTVTVTNAQAGTYNVNSLRATQFIFFGGSIWTPVQ